MVLTSVLWKMVFRIVTLRGEKKNPLHEHSILVGKVIPHMARG